METSISHPSVPESPFSAQGKRGDTAYLRWMKHVKETASQAVAGGGGCSILLQL